MSKDDATGGSRFRRGSGAYRCACCGKLTRETGHGEADLELCRVCFESAGYENEHQDGYHEKVKKAECPCCQGLECLHEKVS